MYLRRALLLGAFLLVAAGSAEAQTRFSISGGALIPLGKFDDMVDPSGRVGARFEYQPVNALGKPSKLSLFVTGSYVGLELDPVYKEELEAAGESLDPYLVEVGGGVRVYSRLRVFFITGGAGYVYHQIHEGDAGDGLDLNLGAGFAIPVYLFTAEAQALGHQVFVSGTDFQHLEATVSLALPF